MKFLIDAQLPQKFVGWLQEQGHDAIHTLDLPRKNATPDSEVIKYAVTDSRIVVSKDSVFSSISCKWRAIIIANINR